MIKSNRFSALQGRKYRENKDMTAIAYDACWLLQILQAYELNIMYWSNVSWICADEFWFLHYLKLYIMTFNDSSCNALTWCVRHIIAVKNWNHCDEIRF